MGIVVGIVAITLAIWLMLAFNRLIRLRNQYRTAWADIDVQLQRRHDLVPQLVEAVRGYAKHERATLEAVTELRTQAKAAQGMQRQGEVETQLEQALTRLIALQEAYPELKASGNFQQLSSGLVTVEDHLQYARRFYNGAVRDYNDTIQRFPDLLIARVFGFRGSEFFQADAGSQAAPKVELGP
ncbi:MAG: LemA family protein [Thermomonas sp.]|uniref:LemA family protein n=1 Tax=Thermomonas sp. TaxID=1971895 RepID=UPI00261CE716|nr:LemA family protein [Thermomonas sp.]MCC7096540.1 LemA family protein [Thermomonas sp.]